MNPYRILKTDNGYEIVRVSYDARNRPQNRMPLDFINGDSRDEVVNELWEIFDAQHWPQLTYADFKREG